MFPSKSPKAYALLTISILIFGNLISISAQANTIKKVAISKAGHVVSSEINTLLSGKGAPKSTTGINGDFYIDTNNMNMYGPKLKGKWPAAVSLKGTAGTNGTNGSTGATGAKGTSSNGSDGATGATGATGSAGPAGAPGSTGPAGSSSPGATGPAGSNGTSGSNGTNGSNGAPGSIGETGAKGDTGSKGDTGNVGLTGPAGSSPSTMGLLTFTTMIGSSSSTSIKDFGNFALGKNYIVQLLLHGVAQDSATKLIKFAASSPDSLVTLTLDYAVLNGYTSRSGSPEQESSIIATILVNGTNTTHDYYLTATITCNEGSVTPGLIFSGSFTGIQVGSIS